MSPQRLSALDASFLADAQTLPDADALGSDLDAAFDELLAAGKPLPI